MPKIVYEKKRFAPWKLDLVKKALSIVEAYKKQGYDLTLRQVYYQFVARDWLPQKWADPATGSTNNERSYKNLGNLLSDARMNGMMDWYSMVDRTREMGGNAHWSEPAEIVEIISRQYAIDKWQDQPYRPEVWVEKDALEGVVAIICRRLDIPYFSCRGYTSQTSIWLNAQRLKVFAQGGQIPHILHLGDHDPSGIDMSRDVEDRVRKFMGSQGVKLEFKRIALNMDQVTQYNPPENPAKITDSRCKAYKELYGDSCWELDALEPSVISNLIQAEVDRLRNDRRFEGMVERETTERALLKLCSDRWDDVVRFLERDDDDA